MVKIDQGVEDDVRSHLSHGGTNRKVATLPESELVHPDDDIVEINPKEKYVPSSA